MPPSLADSRVHPVDIAVVRVKPRSQDPLGLPTLLDRAAVAQLLNCSKRTVDNRVAAQTIPYIKLGALVRFKRSDLDAYIEAHRVPGKDDLAR